MNPWLIIERLALTAWVGGLLVTGFVVTPLLFRVLEDRALAGNIAGQLFSLVSVIGMVCALTLLFIAVTRSTGHWYRAWRVWVLLTMLLIVVVGEYGLAPAIREIIQLAGTTLVKDSSYYPQFARLHGISSMLFLVNSLLGIIMVASGAVSRESQS